MSILEMILWLMLSVAALGSAGHALLTKRDPRAALGWIVVCLVLPGVGVCLYWLLGVNRIRIRAREWQEQGVGMLWLEPRLCPWFADLPGELQSYAPFLNLVDAVTRRPLLMGNRIAPLHCGEEVYPAMLTAIAAARTSIFLSSYIFDSDATGRTFVTALKEATERGCDVRVLVDALGERYSRPSIHRLFKGSKVRVARFLPPSLSGRGIHFNLRNHRKVLVVDGAVGFTGGMNIGDRHLAATDNPRRVVDLHFRVEGPVVGQMQDAFLEDWHFATSERFTPLPHPPPLPEGGAFCRGISAGPNEDFEKLSWIVIGALNSARHRVRIMTPYFIPDRPLITALTSAALRGVTVQIALPGKNNLPYVAWASTAYLWELLQYGVQIYFHPPPFVHSKLLLIDEHYALVGSANLDPRSLRLNFEFCLEVYDGDLPETLSRHFDEVLAAASPVDLAQVDGRPFPRKLRDAFAKLFSPYL